jgi:hypothetical protein
MTDEDLIGYLCDALEPGERAAVDAHLRADPDAAARLGDLRLALAPLEADRETEPAPAGLADRTVARLAAALALLEPTRPAPSDAEVLAAPADERPLALPRAPREAPEPRAVGGRFRPDLLVAAGIALFAGALIFSGVGKLRAQHQLVACQSNLRTLHTGLAGYADAHGGRYPQVGVGANPTAGSFAAVLAESGQVPANFRPACPAATAGAVGLVGSATAPVSPAFVGYTYTLGYRTPGGLAGVRRPTGPGDEHDLIPISADYPSAAAAPAAGPVCPHPAGMNILYAGGQVRVTNSALIGPHRDHIYCNFSGAVAAGEGPFDFVLGRPGDRP